MGVKLGVGLLVGVHEGVPVPDRVGVPVCVCVFDGVGVQEAVPVPDRVGVPVGVPVGVCVGVPVLEPDT